MKNFYLIILLLMTLMLVGCGGQAQSNDDRASTNDEIKISVLDVGQGDSILIQTGEQTILIDTSDTDERKLLVSELENFSVTKINKLILSHPHADHIGNAKALIKPSQKTLAENHYLEKISVDEVYDNGVDSNSPIYKNYVKAIESKNIPHKALKIGDILDFGNGVKFEILYPPQGLIEAVNNGQKSDPNNESVVGKLIYKNFSMLFTGDAEKKVETDLCAKNDSKTLKCDVLKAGHHGSITASSEIFLEAVQPKYVVISCGPEENRRNTYGHPHKKPLKNYLAQGLDSNHIFCTRWNGTITIISDGKNFSVEPQKREEWLDQWLAKKKNPQKR